MDSFSPEMLTLARDSRRLTQSALAHDAGITQGTISKLENGQGTASSEILSKLGATLGYQPSLFFEPFVPTHIIRHRKRQALSATDLKAIHATAAILRLQIHKLIKSVDLPENRIPEIDIERLSALPWEAAREVRTHWGLPVGPDRKYVSSP